MKPKLKPNILQTVLLGAALLGGAPRAEIREIKSMNEVLDIRPQGDTLYVFDLDNTIIEPVQQLGSDQWGSWWMKKLEASGLSPVESRNIGVALFSEVQLKTEVKTVEPQTSQIFGQIKSENAVLGLTARPLQLIERSHQELASVGICFTGGARALRESNTQLDSSIQKSDGIIFVGPHNNKGEVLKQYLLGLKNPYQNVVFVDDKRHHVESVDEALKGFVHVWALRYGAADETVAKLDPVQTNAQWADFKMTGVLK